MWRSHDSGVKVRWEGSMVMGFSVPCPWRISLPHTTAIFNCSEFLTWVTLRVPWASVCCVAHGLIGTLNTRPASSRSTTVATLAMLIAATVLSGSPTKAKGLSCGGSGRALCPGRGRFETLSSFRTFAYLHSGQRMALLWQITVPTHQTGSLECTQGTRRRVFKMGLPHPVDKTQKFSSVEQITPRPL